MSSNNPARWAIASREVINRVLASLPTDANMADKRRALREAFPFGVRKNHPYKVWCAEVRLALGLPEKLPKGTPVVEVSPIGVRCGWCQEANEHQARCGSSRPDRKSCLACCALRQKWEREKGPYGMTDWVGWQKWWHILARSPKDTVGRLVYADFLEEQGWPEQARVERAKVTTETPS